MQRRKAIRKQRCLCASVPLCLRTCIRACAFLRMVLQPISPSYVPPVSRTRVMLPYSPTRHQTQHEGRLYTLRIHCGENYPDRCPVVRFVSKLNMGCVDQRSGEVVRNKLAVLAQWNRNYGIEQVRGDVRM